MKITIECDTIDELKRIALALTKTVAPGAEEETLSESVKALGLCVRTKNCLLGERIDTIGALLQQSPASLLMVPHLGRRSVKEIEEVLAARGLKLRSY